MILPYPKEVIKHFRNPKNLGRIRSPDAVGEAGNLLCGDVLRVYLKIKEKNGKKIISDIKAEVFGCIVAIANTSMLTTMVKGKSLEDALKIEKEELIKKLGGRKKIPAFKIHCSILASDALHEAIYNYYSKNKLPIPEELKKEHERIQNTLKTIEEEHKEFIKLEREVLTREK
jgi:nitrogen fixation NifU-like protein